MCSVITKNFTVLYNQTLAFMFYSTKGNNRGDLKNSNLLSVEFLLDYKDNQKLHLLTKCHHLGIRDSS